MGLKDWIARNIAGPKGYGGALGRPAREGGAALANAVFRGYGSKAGEGSPLIFDTAAEMQSAGFNQVYKDPSEVDLSSLSVDQRSLLGALKVAMISYASIVNSNAALQFMRRDNTSKFREGFGPSLLQSMADSGSFDNIEQARTEVLFYVNSLPPNPSALVLNVDKVASGDLLEFLIVKAVQTSRPKSKYAFVRNGLTGFDTVVISLVEETLKSIAAATRKFNW